MLALTKLFPAVNANPNSTGGYNYVQSEIFNQNNRQWTIRGDYNISDATKVFVRYNYQREVQQFPVGLWWRNGDQVPYPSAIEGKNKSDSWSGSITHVFNSTMTNETIIAYTFVGFPMCSRIRQRLIARTLDTATKVSSAMASLRSLVRQFWTE